MINARCLIQVSYNPCLNNYVCADGKMLQLLGQQPLRHFRTLMDALVQIGCRFVFLFAPSVLVLRLDLHSEHWMPMTRFVFIVQGITPRAICRGWSRM